MTAQYLLRFDDLCPTMDSGRWRRFKPLLTRFDVRPILAVVPDNQDPLLCVEPADAGFWDEMRSMQAAGAAIGLHGYQHVCVTEGRGLVPLHARTEFAGASPAEQRRWIGAGVGILRQQGLEPRVWVAPRHGFDRHTIEALREQGITVISDGFARRPYRAWGAAWIPQQIWAPVEKQAGFWTICVHAGTASEHAVAALEVFLEKFSAQFTSVDRVLAEWPILERSLADRLSQAEALLRIRLRRRLRIYA